MAKPLVFNFNGSEVSFQMAKVDRAKLYGFKELEVLDEQGRKCELATLADDGRTVVAKGGTGMGYLDADGNWCEKSNLKPVNLEGEEITPVPSSFGSPIELAERVTIDQYMEHTIRAIYTMTSENDDALLAELKEGAIFKFDYSFRGGLEADAGFLLLNEEDKVFFAVGSSTSIEMVGLQQTAPTVEEADVASDDDGDMMDFGMI